MACTTDNHLQMEFSATGQQLTKDLRHARYNTTLSFAILVKKGLRQGFSCILAASRSLVSDPNNGARRMWVNVY